jgi:beta-glucosidase
MTTAAYANSNLAIEDRVKDLIERMELDEKLAQLGALEFPRLITGERFDPEAALAVVPHGIGQVTRIGATTGLEPQQSAELFNQIQKLVVERTALGSRQWCTRSRSPITAPGGPPCSPRRSLWRVLGTRHWSTT